MEIGLFGQSLLSHPAFLAKLADVVADFFMGFCRGHQREFYLNCERTIHKRAGLGKYAPAKSGRRIFLERGELQPKFGAGK